MQRDVTRFIDLRVRDVTLVTIDVSTQRRAKRPIGGWLERVLGVAILVGTGWALWTRRSAFDELLDASWLGIAIMGVLTLAGWFMSAAQTWVLFKAELAPIGFWENQILAASANFANYLPMRVGTVVRGRYMKRLHGLRYARFGSIFGIRTVLLVSASGLLGVAGTIGLSLFEGRHAWVLLGGFILLTAGSIIALAVRLPRLDSNGTRLARIWNDFVDGFAMARARPKVSFIVIVLTLLQQLALSMRLYVGFDAFQTSPSAWFVVLLAPLVMLVSFVAITPGGLGLREAAIGYVAFAAGGDFSLGLFAGSLDRAVMLALTLLLGTPSFVYIWRRLGSAERQEGSPTDSRTGSRSRASLR